MLEIFLEFSMIFLNFFPSFFLQRIYGFSPTNAGWITGSMFVSSMIFSPIVGKVLDITGKRTHFRKYWNFPRIFSNNKKKIKKNS